MVSFMLGFCLFCCSSGVDFCSSASCGSSGTCSALDVTASTISGMEFDGRTHMVLTVGFAGDNHQHAAVFVESTGGYYGAHLVKGGVSSREGNEVLSWASKYDKFSSFLVPITKNGANVLDDARRSIEGDKHRVRWCETGINLDKDEYPNYFNCCSYAKIVLHYLGVDIPDTGLTRPTTLMESLEKHAKQNVQASRLHEEYQSLFHRSSTDEIVDAGKTVLIGTAASLGVLDESLRRGDHPLEAALKTLIMVVRTVNTCERFYDQQWRARIAA